jgi:hypothetical protein
VLLASLALLLAPVGVRAEEEPEKPKPSAPAAPVLAGSSALAAEVAAQPDILSFRSTQLIDPFVYRSILKLPAGSSPDQATAKLVAEQIISFLRNAGYDLAKVRAVPVDDKIAIDIDEGSLDKIIITGAGWLKAIRFRNALRMPGEIFNSKVLSQEMPRLAKSFGLKSWRWELWPVHMLDADNATAYASIEELRVLPMVRAARGFEMRIFPEGEAWGSGLAPEVNLTGQFGLILGGRYRGRNLIQDGDRWQFHFRVGSILRSGLVDGATEFVNFWDYLSMRWISRSWDGSGQGLRATVVARSELWTMQRSELWLEKYRIENTEVGTGAGAQLTPAFSLYLTAGIQRHWLFDIVPAVGHPPTSVVTEVPGAANRLFLRLNSQYTFNPDALRRDVRDMIEVELSGYQPARFDSDGYLSFDLQARKLWPVGWHELRAATHITEQLGNVPWTDEVLLSNHLRIGFGLDKYTERIATFLFDFRYSLLRDKLKTGVFADLAFYRHLPRDDPEEKLVVAGSVGPGLFLLFMEAIQFDLFVGAGWSSDGYLSPGLWLHIQETF